MPWVGWGKDKLEDMDVSLGKMQCFSFPSGANTLNLKFKQMAQDF